MSHLSIVKKEREYYKFVIAVITIITCISICSCRMVCKTAKEAYDKTHPPMLPELMHYSFDFAQQVH